MMRNIIFSGLVLVTFLTLQANADNTNQGSSSSNTSTPASVSTDNNKLIDNASKQINQANAKVKKVLSNTAITSAIKHKLAKNSLTSAVNIHVRTKKNGVVRLWGNARSDEERTTAENLALNTEGVSKVINDIKVKH